MIFIIKGFRTIFFSIFIVISTTFRPICPPAFFRCLLSKFLSRIRMIFIIKDFWTIVFIFIVISTTFRSICPPAFSRCLSNSETYTELWTTSFIESEQVTPMDFLFICLFYLFDVCFVFVFLFFFCCYVFLTFRKKITVSFGVNFFFKSILAKKKKKKNYSNNFPQLISRGTGVEFSNKKLMIW